MFKALLAGGRSSDARSSSSSTSSSRRRTESKASSTVSRKPSRGDDRDRGLGDLSAYPTSGNRSKRYAPSAAGDSVASSYATAEPHSVIEPDRNVIERAPRRRDTDDSERRDRYSDSDGSDDKPRRRRNLSRSQSRERTRERPDNTDELDNGNRGSRHRRERRRTQPDELPSVPISGAEADLAPKVGTFDYPQFPPPFHNTHPVTSMPSSPNVPGVYDPHVQQQFPGQFPAFVAEPNPPNPAGAAADYYGDQGQSVAQQPGVRPEPPKIIPNTQAHLMPASPHPNPPQEPSSMGQTPAAADYYADDTDPEIQAPEQSSKPPAGPTPKPPRPTIQTEGVLGPAATATAHDEGRPQGIGSGSSPMLESPTPTSVPLTGTSPSRPPNAQDIGTAVGAAAATAAAGYVMGHHHQSSLNVEHLSQSGNHNNEEGFPNLVGPAGPSAYSDQLNAPPLNTAGAETTAYAADPSHPHHAALYHGAPFQSGSMAFQQRQRGPLDKFIDFWRDAEGVGMFEDYTETIGVCRHCFEPGTSSRDAPRRHYYRRRRRSSDRYSSRSRVGKPSRYSSSEDEGRRRKKTSISSWLPGMLAGYTPFIKKDFENTYSDRSGRPASSPSDNENLSTLEKQSHTSRGVCGRSPRRSYEGLRDNESRWLSRSTSRSSSKSEKHCAHRDVGTAITGVSENQPRRSRSPRKTKSRKSSSSESSFVDISRPSMKSVGGLSSFFTASENRRKRQSKKRISIFSFNNSSSSSLDADLAFGNGYAKRPPGKSKRRSKKKDQDDVDAALLGIGAAATAIADSTHHRSRRTGEVLIKKEPTPTRLGYSSSSTNDDAWEDVDSGDQSSSSVSSALAFGGSGLYGSTASPSSDSGTSLWGWRWGNRKGKKQKRTRSNASESRFPTNAALAAGALGTAALAHRYNNQGRRTSEGAGSGAGNLQHVAPVPTSDPSQFDAVNVPPSPPQPVIRPRGHIPLQQPQPVAPVSQAVYTSQGETIPPYTVPSRPPPFANTLSHYDYQAHGSGLREHEIPLYRDFTDIRSNVNRPPRRSDSSPVFHTEPLVSTSVPSAKRRSTMKDQGSVQFDLTREQAEKERRADQFEHQKRDHGSQGVELIDREAHADKNRSRRYYEGHRDSDFGPQEGYGREPRGERSPASWDDLGTSAGSVLSGQSFNGNPSESSQRSHQERSEKRRAERRRASGSEISSGLPMPERAYDDVDQRPNPVPAQEHFKTSVFRDIPRKKPVHDDYAQFFAPKELRYSPDTYARREPASTPTIIEAEPASQKIKATEEHHPEYRGLPWPVPKLNVVEPTPPQSQSGSVRDIASPIPSPPEVLDDDRKSKRSTTGSRVSWGKDETREYEVPSTSSELDSADHDIVADRGQEKQNDSGATREIAAIQADLPKAANGYNPDIVVAATAGAAAEALGFDPSLVSVITEKLVSPSRAGSYVGGAVTPDDGEKQPILKKSFENGPLYSEPVSISDSVRTFHDDQQPSSIAQEVIQQLSGEQASEMGELSGRTVEKPNEGQPTLVFRDERSGTKSAPEEVSHMSGGFRLEESTSQREPRGNTQEPVQDDLRSIIPAVIPRHSDTPMEGANCSKYSRDSDIPSQASPPAAEEGSTIEKKKRKKRHSKRGSGTFDDSVSVASSPARVEETSDRGRSTDEQTKEKRAGGILSNIFGSKVSEPLASRKSSSDSYPSREVQSEVGPPDSGESRRQRREEKRRQKYGELADSGKTTEREKDRTISQDGDDQPSFLAGSPEMPYQVGDGDREGASGRISSTDAELAGLGLDVFEQRPRSRSASPPAPGRTMDLSPKSQSRPNSPRLARGHEDVQGQQSRRSSGVRPTESPTAVPLHFRRPPTTSPRAHRSSSASSIAAPSPGSPTGRSRRPASGEFINSREMRPLWLVEHHGSKIEVQPEEPLPSLPSSKTSSVNASAEDLASLQDEKIWEKFDLSPSIHGDQRPIDVDMPSNSQHRVLDSEEVTPTAASFGQMNTNQLLRKDKPKYEFHSPSELLQDPSTYPELPPSPTMGALPSAEGSAVGVKDDGGLERNLDSLPPLPLSRPATPKMEQIRASDSAEGHLTRELTAPDLEAPRISGDVAPSADGDTTIMNVLNVDLPELQPSDEKTPTKATQSNIESGDALMSDEPTSRDLSNEVVPVPPAVQIPTTEAMEKGRENPGYAATSPTEVVNSTIADPLLPAGEERALSAEPLQAVTTGETKAGISDTADEITQPQEAQRGMKSEPQKSATGDNESLGSAEAKPESNPNLTSATIISVEGEETETVDEAAVTESTKPTRESTDKAADEVAQAPTEEGVVGATSPSSSKKKKKDKKKKPKSVNIHEPESQDTPATALAALSTPEDVEEIDEAITQGESSIEQISLPEGTDKPSEAEVESAIDLSKPHEAANVQAPVDMPISEPEPVVDIIKTEDALATEDELAVTALKSGEEADTQIKEGRLPSDWEPTAQAVNPQNVVDLAASTNPSKQEPPLEIPQPENAHLASDTSATEQKPNPEVLVTDVARSMQAPEATTIPVQGLPKAEDAPIITDVLSPEQAMPRAEEEAHQESLQSDKMLDSNAKPAATDSEAAADIDVLTNNLETDEDRRKVSKSFDANESVKELGDVEIVTSSQTEPEVTLQASEELSRSAIDDYPPVKEALLPSEEITSSSEHPVQGTMEGAESLELSGQDAVLPETPFEQPELQESTEHNTSVREEAPGVVFEPSSAVLEQSTEAASVRGENSSAAGLQEGLSSEMSAVDPAPVESESGPLQLESEQTTRTDEAKAPMEPSSGQISPEQQQMQGNPAPVEPISSPEPAAEIADAGTKTQDADVTDAQTENSLSRRNCNNMEKSKRDSDTEPPVEKVGGDVPPDVPSNDGATPRAEDEPAIPPKEEPEARQPEEAPDNAHEGAINVSPETMSGAVAERPIESQDAGSAETAQKAGSEEAPEGQQPTKKGKKKKKNRKSISSDPQAVADAETQPPLSAEGLAAETPLAETSGVVYPTDDKHIPQDATATNEVAETTEAVDAIPAAENESNVPVENPAETNHSTPHIAEHVPDDPVPDAEPEAGGSTPAGKKNKKKKKKKQSLPSLPDAHVAASEPTSNTEVASPNIDIPVAIEKPPATEGQELVQEEATGSEQPLDVTEAVEDTASPETAPAMSAAEKKKTKKEQKKHRKSASLDETLASDRALNPSPENASLERDPTSVGKSAPSKEPEEHGASAEEPTVVDELASEQPRVETVTDTEPAVALNEGLDEQSQEPAQQEPEETPTDIAGVSAIEAGNLELGQTQHTDHTPLDFEGTPENEKHSGADAEERHMVERMGVEQETTGEKKVEVESGDATLDAAPTMNADTALEQPKEEAPSEEAAPEQTIAADIPLTDIVPQDTMEQPQEGMLNETAVAEQIKDADIPLVDIVPQDAPEQPHEEAPSAEAAPEQTKDTDMPLIDVVPQDTLQQPQEGTLDETAVPEQTEDAEISLTDVIPQNAVDGEAEPPAPKKSKKDKKKKKKQQSISLADDQPAAAREEIVEEPSDARSDILEIPEQPQLSFPDNVAEESQHAFSEKPTQQPESNEPEPTESPEQVDLTRPLEPEPMADTQESVSKKKAKKDKKKRKSVSFANNEQEAPTKSSEATETTEASHHVREASQPPEQTNEQMAEASSLVQESQENADNTTADEVQPRETTSDLHKGVPTVALGEDGPESNKEVVPHDEQVTQPYNDSVTEAQASTLGPIDPDPMGQTPSVARELVNETIVPEGGYANDDASVTEPLEEQVQQGTGIQTAPETSEKHGVESAPEASVLETPPTSVQESTVVVQEAEQESGSSKSKKDKKKKKKRKTQETIENETSVVPEPSIEEAPVQAEEDNGTAAPGVIEEVIEPDNAAKPSEISSQDVPSMAPEGIVEHARAETEQVVDGTVHEVNESEGTEQQAREQPEIAKNDGAPAMSAKERKKAKKKERKRQSKNLDGSGAASTAAESASIVPEEKTQGPLINASTTSTGDVAHEATATQVSAGLKPSDPSVDTATLPAEDDGKENQSHGTESHGENDKNLFWTDHMVSSQVDQQQATPVDSPTKPVPENTEAEKVVVSGESVTMSEQIEVGTEDHASTTEQEATSEADRVSLEHLPAEDVSAETDESGKVFTPNWDELKTQRDTTAETTGQGSRKDTMPAQTDEKLEEKDQEAVPEASLVAVEVRGTSVNDPLATDEKTVSLSPAEAGVPGDLRETNTGSAIDVEKPEAVAPWKDLHQAQQPDDSQPEDNSSQPNLVSTTSTDHVTREAKDSELEVSNAGPATENDTNEDKTASPRETRLEGVDLVSDSQTVEESRCSGAEVTNKSKSAEASSEIQAEPQDLLPVSSGEENREDKETPSMSDTAREKPDGRETTAELPEANKRATLDPVESLGPRSQPLAEKELQASIEPTPEQLNHEELKGVTKKGEEENMTQTLSRKASKKQKKKAKKQAKATSIEMADPSPAESKRGINAGSNLEAVVGSTAITGAAESSLAPGEKPMQDQVQGPQSVSGVSKPVFEAVSATEERSPPMPREVPAQTQATHELQEGEDKDAETQGKLSSQTSEGGDPEAAEERIGGHSTQQETPAPGTVSKEVGGRSKQEAGLQIPERADQPASGGNTESTEVALLVHEAKPESSEPPMTEVSTAEKSPFEALSRENTQKIEEDLSVEIREPEEIGSTSGKANVKPSQDQYQSETLATERSAKDDEWPMIDWEKEKVDALEQTPQSSPEAVAAPFEPDESAEAIEAKANMGPQGQDSEAKLATPEEQFAPSREEPKTEPILEAAREHSLDDSISGKQAMGDTGSVSQKQSKIASIFPNLERGSFRRPITTKSSESVKDGAEDETNDQGASRGDAMQVSEAPIAATFGKDNDHIANPFMASERTTTATLEDLPGGTTVHDIQMPVASRLAQGNHKNPEDVLYTEAESAGTGSLAREIPLYEPTPIHEQPPTFISSSSNAMCIDRQASPGSLRQLGRSPSIQGTCDPSPRPKPSEEATLPAQPNSTLPSSAFRVPSVVDRGAISPPRTPLQPIAEHEPIDRTRTPIGVMHQEQGTPCLEMKPEHVLPRPETLIRKFTDNALARQAWPTLDKDGDQDFHIRKRGSARSIDHESPTGAIQTPERGVPILRPSSMGSIKSVHSAHSQRSLRRMDRSASGDLRTASQAQTGARQSSRSPQPPPVEPPPSDFNIEHIASSSSYDPVTDKGKRPLRDMADVYEGWGETPNSPRSPSRPPSIRHRRSMQHLQELETRLDQLVSENRLLVAAREAAEDKLRNASVARRKSDHALNERAADLRDREAEVEQLKNSVEWLQKEVSRLTEENEGLTVANSNITVAHAAEIQTIRASSNRELDDLRLQNQQLSSEMQDRVRKEIDAALSQKNMELRRLREDLESARDKVKELQQQIAASMQDSVLVFRDEDYFDAACQKLCGHVQQWVLRFSKHSDLRRCRKLDDIQDEKIADRFENAILDGSDADVYLSDRVRRRDVFMSVVMTMVWEFIFTRYLFGMDREQRQKLKSIEKQLGEVGPRGAVHRWRATTLSLLSKRPAFSRQRQNDTEAVALEIFETLSRLLPPPSNVEPQLLESLRKVLRVAVNLSIEMRTQLAEYIMLPPLQPEYDTNGDLARQVYFNASLMNERSGETTSNEELESQQAVVRVVLFPLVVKKGNDAGEGEDEVVVCPAQVLVARSPKDKKVTRMLSGDRMSLDGTRSIHSIAPSSTMDMSNVI
ncbi:hypothetical protein G4B84_011041 [Aspergillus flavus NRRL3357]|nr:uncharacterized protein G4B84_011041 [Aspergillus flavus NRRL3357]QMW35550.1 hypothetical protein G4B84_011041 [Aspergillus flavus NRRL3357]QMW47613.1 hypothetical protein G4B11_011092 [Aspergillus flavus]